MGSRMMSGNTKFHEELENKLSDFIQKEDTILLNFGYQGIMSSIDALVDRKDVIIYDSECHACIIDGVRLHQGKRFVFPHSNILNFEKQLQRAQKITDETDGGILVLCLSVYSMEGHIARLPDFVELAKEHRAFVVVDDAHGFGVLGAEGRGVCNHFGLTDEVDVICASFSKSLAGSGGFEKLAHITSTSSVSPK
jgi:glycine C-acetyltransferase